MTRDMTGNRFELEFKLTEAQFCQAHRAYLRRSLLTVKNLFLVTIALLIGVVQTQLFGTANWVLWVYGAVWLAVVGLAVFVFIRMPSKIYQNRPGLSDLQKVIVDEDGLDWTLGAQKQVLQWSDIERASDLHPDYVFFHIRHGLPRILPKDVFSSEEELLAFDRLVQKNLNSQA